MTLIYTNANLYTYANPYTDVNLYNYDNPWMLFMSSIVSFLS